MNPDANPLPTPSGRIENFFQRKLRATATKNCRHPTWIEPPNGWGADAAPRNPLQSSDHAPSTRLHGQMAWGASASKAKVRGASRMRIKIADDAAARGIRDGDVVGFFTSRGAILAGAILTRTFAVA